MHAMHTPQRLLLRARNPAARAVTAPMAAAIGHQNSAESTCSCVMLDPSPGPSPVAPAAIRNTATRAEAIP